MLINHHYISNYVYQKGCHIAQVLLAGMVVSAMFNTALADGVPTPILDARSAGMGGANIVQSVRNASFYNPALLAVDPDEYEWYLMPYSSGDFDTDPDKVKSGVKAVAAGASNSAEIISDINGDSYVDFDYNSSLIVIPSATLGGSLYVAEYELHSGKIVTDVIGDTYLDHRSVDVFELGFSVGKLVNFSWLNLDNVMVGINTKILLLKSFGYQELINTASVKLDNDLSKRDSEINFDLGISKEYGVWKTGLVIKNLLTQENNFGDSNGEYKLSPQIRAGMGFKSRRTVIEVDLDLTKTEGLGYASDRQNAALGWELRAFPGFYLRLGYNQNLVGDAESTLSGGIGVDAGGVLIDFAIMNSGDGDGAFAQFAFEL